MRQKSYKVVFIETLTIVLAFSSLIYELVYSTLFSFLFGSTIEMYSLVIGIYLFSLGVGSLLFYKFKRKIKNLDRILLYNEIAITIISLAGILALLITYRNLNDFTWLLSKIVGFSFVFLIGVLSGIELPLLMEIYKKETKKEAFAKILTLDYFGSLIAGVLFPLLLYPKLGLITTLILTLFLNSLAVFSYLAYKEIKKYGQLRINLNNVFMSLWVLILFFLLLFSAKIQNFVIKKFTYELIKEDMDYLALDYIGKVDIKIDNLTFSKYQIIYKYTMKINNYSFSCLGLNGITQFCSHNYLPHHFPYFLPFYLLDKNLNNSKILILGGGDGILANELLKFGKKYGLNFNITMVELDPKVVGFNRENFKTFNNNSFSKIKIIYGDAFIVLRELKRKNEKFDFIFDDLDVSNWDNKIKLYSLEFFSLVNSLLKKDGVYVLEAVNVIPYFPSDKSTITLIKTLNDAGFKYFLYFHTEEDVYKKGNIIITPYEDGFILTNKKFNVSVSQFMSFEFEGKNLRVSFLDNTFQPLKDVVNFYSFYKLRANSIFWPNYYILKV